MSWLRWFRRVDPIDALIAEKGVRRRRFTGHDQSKSAAGYEKSRSAAARIRDLARFDRRGERFRRVK